MVLVTCLTRTDTANDAYPAAYTTFKGYQAHSVTVRVWSASAFITFSFDADGIDGDETELDIGIHNFDIECKGFRIRNRTPGSNARYEVVGWMASKHATAAAAA